MSLHENLNDCFFSSHVAQLQAQQNVTSQGISDSEDSQESNPSTSHRKYFCITLLLFIQPLVA